MSGLVLSIVLGFVPLLFFAQFIYWLDRYEKEPLKLLIFVFFWGLVVAACGSYLINTIFGMGIFLFTNSEQTTQLMTGLLIAPIVEEILKGIAVLIVLLLFKPEFDSVLDGVVYAAIVALGFAAVENSYYIYNFGYL
jgi:RsiW-degrading membrane proteinase PrsW (M82 family)